LLGIPVIAQGFEGSPYNQDKDHLTLVTDNSQWYNEIVKIKENYSEYKAKAMKAQEYVLQEYNIKHYAPTWVEAINKLCKFQKTY
jgi:hypothetical protein